MTMSQQSSKRDIICPEFAHSAHKDEPPQREILMIVKKSTESTQQKQHHILAPKKEFLKQKEKTTKTTEIFQEVDRPPRMRRLPTATDRLPQLDWVTLRGERPTKRNTKKKKKSKHTKKKKTPLRRKAKGKNDRKSQRRKDKNKFDFASKSKLFVTNHNNKLVFPKGTSLFKNTHLLNSEEEPTEPSTQQSMSANSNMVAKPIEQRTTKSSTQSSIAKTSKELVTIPMNNLPQACPKATCLIVPHISTQQSEQPTTQTSTTTITTATELVVIPMIKLVQTQPPKAMAPNIPPSTQPNEQSTTKPSTQTTTTTTTTTKDLVIPIIKLAQAPPKKQDSTITLEATTPFSKNLSVMAPIPQDEDESLSKSRTPTSKLRRSVRIQLLKNSGSFFSTTSRCRRSMPLNRRGGNSN